MGLLKSVLASWVASRTPTALSGAAPRANATLDDAWRNLVDAGRYAEALALVDDALAATPEDSVPRIARADVLKAWGREHEAALEIRRAAKGGASGPDIARRQAWAAIREGRAEEAIEHHRGVLALDPFDAESTLGLGSALMALGRLDEAAACLRDAQIRAPGDLALLLALGSCELARKRPSDAEAHFRRAVALAPGNAAAHEHHGVALAALDRHDEALAALAEAERLARASGETVDAFVNIGIGLCETGKASEGIRVLVDGLRERPNLNGYLQLGPALLSQGRFRPGWRYYEHRWLAEPFASMRADYGVPHWMGQPLQGRTILVRSEQGLGDVFQFVRYLRLLEARGARVLFQPLKGVDRIARRFPGIDHVLADGERLPPLDFCANLMSLPLAFGTTVASIPAETPYLSPDPEFVAKWASRFADRARPRVGLVWAGRPTHRSDRLRSMRLEQLAPILDVEGVRFVSLQKGPAAEQAEIVPERVDWDGVGPELDELDDAAAVIAELDLLIAVDTGLAHLAGAMGKAVWLMLQTPSEYRWMTGREDTPWYPTMRLFRQEAPREWGTVVERVAGALRRWASNPQRGSPRPTLTPETSRSPDEAPGSVDGPMFPGLAIAAETRSGFLQFVPDEPGVGRSLEHYGEWLQPRLDVALGFVRRGSVLIEAAAGAGAHVLPLARATGAEGVVLAFESRAAFRRLLAQNLAAHRITHVAVMARALGGEGSAPGTESVDGLGLARLDGIKVNEGADAVAILEGAGQTLWRCRPWILVGSSVPQELGRVREALREFGYRAWRLETPLHSPANFNRRSDDVFPGQSAHALFALPEEADVRAPLPGGEAWP